MATKPVAIGPVVIGGGRPVVIQSMTNTKTSDVAATLIQIQQLVAEGCEIVRVSVPDKDSVTAVRELKSAIDVPLVADVHFQPELAIGAIKAGADKVRINPGNIGGPDDVRRVVEAAGEHGVAIRIGVNSGSLSDEIRGRDAGMAEMLVASALESMALVESVGFTDMVLSVKSPGVPETVAAYRRLASQTDYPLHLGITESGTLVSGSIKSAVGLGLLLADGIGDTIRVSLAADPVHEVRAAQQILQALELRRFHPELIACPTCARCEVDLIPIASEVEDRLRGFQAPIKIALMGCVVNGPGEARDADIGLAAGRGKGVLFRAGKRIKTVKEADFVDELMAAIESVL